MLVVPHVESTVMATDLAGLKLIQDAGCFECFTTWREAKVKGEVAASMAILQARAQTFLAQLAPNHCVYGMCKRSPVSSGWSHGIAVCAWYLERCL